MINLLSGYFLMFLAIFFVCTGRIFSAVVLIILSAALLL